MQVRMLLCLALAALHTTVDGFPRMSGVRREQGHQFRVLTSTQ